MTEAMVTVEQAGDALYTALRVAQDAATVLRADTGPGEFRATFIEAFRTVAIHIAGADAPLSSDEITAIDHIFWLDTADTDQVDAALLAHPDRVAPAVAYLAGMAQLISQADLLLGKPFGCGSNQLMVSAWCVFRAALAAGTTAELNQARLDKVMVQLSESLPDDPPPVTTTPVPQVDPAAAQAPDTPALSANGLQPVACPARLHAGESCYATSAAVLFQESNVVRQVRYRGLSGRVGIARGVSYRSGSYKVDRTRSPKIERIADGTLCITDQRLVFLSDTKNLDLPFAKLLSSATEPGTIEVTRPNAGRTMFEQIDRSAVEAFEQITGTSPDHRQAVEAKPAQYERPPLAYKAGRVLGTTLLVLLGLFMLLLYIIL